MSLEPGASGQHSTEAILESLFGIEFGMMGQLGLYSGVEGGSPDQVSRDRQGEL